MNPRDREQVENEVNLAQNMARAKGIWIDDFFESKEAQLLAAFRQVPVGDTEKLSEIHYMSKALHSLQQEVQTVMDSGKLAQAALNEETQP